MTIIRRRKVKAPQQYAMKDFTHYFREVLDVILRVSLEEDAHWCFRFKRYEVAGWDDASKNDGPPAWVWDRIKPADGWRGGVVYFLVENGVGRITGATFKDVGETNWPTQEEN